MSVVSIREKTAVRMGDGGGKQHYPCCACQTLTAWDTLSSFGARCYPCYVAYCREAPNWPAPAPQLSAIEASSSRAWAYRLQRCEERGDTLGSVQKSAWREVLGNPA